MTEDLIERYIYAVTKRMRPKAREDVAQELRGLIDDMVAERCGKGVPSEKDVRIVLTELGSPVELYEKYDTEGKKCLIGSPYYSVYLTVLKAVLLCTAFGLTVANGVLWILEPVVWYAAIGRWLGMLWQGLMGTFAFITILFALFYRYGVRIDKPFNFDELPPVPKKRQEIPRGETISGIGFTIFFLIAFLAVPQIFGFFYGESGEWIPVFRADIVRASWLPITLFSLAGLIREVVKLLERRYNTKVMLVTVITNGLSAIFGVLWLTGRQLINPELQDKMAALFVDDAPFLGRIMMNFQYFFLGVILFALLVDTLQAVAKTYMK